MTKELLTLPLIHIQREVIGYRPREFIEPKFLHLPATSYASKVMAEPR